jgi:glycosyltransferase involved in cell wall biosynthesis
MIISHFTNKTVHMRTSRLLLVTRWGWPFGGGEAFMKDSMKWCESSFTEVLWISFMDATSQQKYRTYQVTQLSETTATLQIPDGMTEGGLIDATVLVDWIKLLDPDVVHHQGADRGVVLKVCQELKIPLLSGFHFWTGVLRLSEDHQNIEMKKHIAAHKQDPEFLDCLRVRKTGSFDYYWASDFMQEIVQAAYPSEDLSEDRCVYPIPSNEHALAGLGGTRDLVTQINVHHGKGGHIFLHCLEHLRHVGFQCIITEPGSEELYSTLKQKAKRRRGTALILERSNDIRTVYARARVMLIPSVVDETFCRVAFEAILNGIPIIASPAGYITTMLKDCKGAVLMESTKSPAAEWLQALTKLVAHDDLLARMGAAAKNHAQCLLEKFNSPQTLQTSLNHLLIRSRRRNIMIFAPWADQGLGVQARNYANILAAAGSSYLVSIFSYKPYYGGQTCPAEWKHDRVYYSPSIREKVTDDEIRHFVHQYDIGTAIIPETCWFRVFEIADFLAKELHVRVFGIPNVEILRQDELQKHEVFHGLLCNNEICMQVLGQAGLKEMCHFVGYTVHRPRILPSLPSTSSSLTGLTGLKFLCLGGMNAFSRKQIDQVCAGFPTQQHLQLTVTNQNVEEEAMRLIIRDPKFQHILFVWKALSYDEILTLYNQCDVVIHVSKHEGLGIGFYEALSFGKPVVTLDVPPHNEIIKTGVNGWLIPATVKPSVENTQSPIGSAFFEPNHLRELIQRLADSPAEVERITESARQDYATRFDVSTFTQRFIDALRI